MCESQTLQDQSPESQHYPFATIEQKWQQRWQELNCFRAANPGEAGSEKEKFYCLVEFPYPSGNGLHVGHPRSYTALDAVARMKRLQGYNVLYPMGWDAFGLPTENYAIQHQIHPAKVTAQNIARFKQQLQALGFSFDWSREVNTTDPEYFRWTQWIFLQLYKHGLAYKKEMPVNWCPSCKVVLANEEVKDGCCERCGTEVIQKVKSQWMLRITQYADKLLEGLDHVDFVERVKNQQSNWIGRSTGAELDFATSAGQALRVYTTRPDTLFGVSYMVVSPEHPLLQQWLDEGLLQNAEAIKAYQLEAQHKSDFQRSEMNKDKSGVRLEGVVALHPITGQELPIFVADYVLINYGTGAIMAVPAHDERDWAFAQKYGLPLVEVVAGATQALSEAPYTTTEQGVLVNSDFLNGLSVQEAKQRMIDYLVEHQLGQAKVNYKLRDWVFSRQRYWGEPIPMVYCEHCGWQPLPESELPLLLPEVDRYEPGDDGSSPLAKQSDWVNCTCPKCHGPAQRETDTMPQWAGSSWYFLRFMDPHNTEALASPEALAYWSPVDWYNGGMEHTTLHLLYSRFWHRFLFDIGVVPNAEPYRRRTSHGMILGTDGSKMSKSRGNVVNPDDVVAEYGADTMRLYEMFVGDFEKAAPWSTKSIRGCERFVERVWQLGQDLLKGDQTKAAEEGAYRPELLALMHQSIHKVEQDLMTLKGNTAIAQLMTLSKRFVELGGPTRAEFRTFLILLSPMAPHIAEELWEQLGYGGYVHEASWPLYDPEQAIEPEVEIAVQVNGKVRDRVMIAHSASAEEAIAAAKAAPEVVPLIEGKTLKREMYIPGRLVTLVV